MTTAKPLPPMGQDPSIVEGQEVRAQFLALVPSIRQNQSLNNLAAAEQITAEWNKTNEKLGELFQDLQRRRQARLDALETTVPLGPAIPAGASAADSAVLHQAFRSALSEARNAVPAQPAGGGNVGPLSVGSTQTKTLDGMLADAEKFDDDNLRRAVLTAAFEGGHMQLVRKWTDLMGASGQLDEYHELRRAIEGQGTAGGWNFTVFRALPAPPEVAQLSQLRAAEEAESLTRAQASAAANRYRRF